MASLPDCITLGEDWDSSKVAEMVEVFFRDPA
jgi:hypothetical protein